MQLLLLCHLRQVLLTHHLNTYQLSLTGHCVSYSMQQRSAAVLCLSNTYLPVGV